jgi:arabinofuranosyltransferase
MSGAQSVVDPPAAAPSTSPRRSPSRARGAAQVALFALPVVWISVLAWTHRWMTEDGFIYLRIARNLGAGDGPVFNPGERVEAYTGVLWVGLLGAGDVLTPIRLEWISIGLGIVGTAAAITLVLAGARKLWVRADERSLFVPLGAVVFVALFPVWAYATSGLETGLVFTWLAACLWILARWAGRPDGRVLLLEMVVLGLGWLVRPEMVLFSAAFVLVVLGGRWSGDTWRQRITAVAAAVALPLAYQVFRMGYFGSLVANTAIAKEGTGGNLDRGIDYLADFADPYWLWVPAVGLLAGGYAPLAARLARRNRGAGDGRRALVVAAFVGSGLLNAAYVVVVGGDYHHARMFLPALFAVCAPVAAVPATRRHLAALAVGAWAVAAVIWFRPDQHEADNWLANGFLAPGGFGNVTAEDLGWGDEGDSFAWYQGPAYYYEVGIGRYPQADMELDPSIELPFGAFWGVGVSGYSVGSDFHVLDQLGLADSFTAHLEGAPSLHPVLPRFPGHEKPIPGPWVAARVTPDGSTPDPRYFPAFGNPLIPPTDGAEFQSEVEAARQALGCDEVAELLASSQAPMSPGRFAENLFRSVENTFLRIPPDPHDARDRFCAG